MRALTRWVVDCAVAAAAAWTVVYHVGLAIDAPVLPLLAVWAALVVLCGAGLVVLRRRATPRAEADVALRLPGARRIGVIVGAGVLAAVSGVAYFWIGLLVFGAVAVVAAVPWVRRAGREVTPEGPEEPERVPWWHDAVAAVVAAGLGVLSVFIVRPDGDDAFYVNRSVWVAEHGRLPVGDVLFGDGGRILPGMAPVSSIEALAGAVARLADARAASVVWYLLPPVITFLSVLALWLLIKAWSPRRALPGLLLAVVFLLWSGQSAASFGSFHLVRAWQGKAMLVSLIVPALWLYLTEWARGRSRLALALAVTAGVAGLGFSSSAAFVIPLTVFAAGLGLAVLGRYRDLPPLLLVPVYPMLGGVVVTVALGAPAGGEPGDPLTPLLTWQWVMGLGLAGAVGAMAVWWGPLLVRGAVPAAFVWATTAIAAVILLPGALLLAAKVTGSAPVLWRSLWIVPQPALIGLLAAVPYGAVLGALVRRPLPGPLRKIAAWAPAAVLSILLIVAATPVWDDFNRAGLVSRPQWKSDLVSGRLAGAVLRAYPDAKVVLAPPWVMRAMVVRTAKVKVVDPRDLYLNSLTDGTADDRRLLSTMAAERSDPPPAGVMRALTDLKVDVACVRGTDDEGLALLRGAGMGNERKVRSLVCMTPRSATSTSHEIESAGGDPP